LLRSFLLVQLSSENDCRRRRSPGRRRPAPPREAYYAFGILATVSLSGGDKTVPEEAILPQPHDAPHSHSGVRRWVARLLLIRLLADRRSVEVARTFYPLPAVSLLAEPVQVDVPAIGYVIPGLSMISAIKACFRYKEMMQEGYSKVSTRNDNGPLLLISPLLVPKRHIQAAHALRLEHHCMRRGS
jgi:hypothetical protein